MSVRVKQTGIWEHMGALHTKRSATPTQVAKVFAKVGGAWLEVWPGLTLSEGQQLEDVTNLKAVSLWRNNRYEVDLTWTAPLSPFDSYLITWTGGGSTTLGNGVLAYTDTTIGTTAGVTRTYLVQAVRSAVNSNGTSVVATTVGERSSITKLEASTYNSIYYTVAGTPPYTLICNFGAHNGGSWPIAAPGRYQLTGLVGTENWFVRNAYGDSTPFQTVAGTPAQGAVAGVVRNTLANPLPAGRGSCSGITWDVPPMSAHANFPYSNCTNGTGATRWQTGNYPKGWVQHSIALPANYRVRRFMFVQGDGAGNTEVVTPVYSVDSGATFKRYSKGLAVWVPATDATINPGGTSPNGLLSNDSGGNFDRDWNYRMGDASTLTTALIPENATDLSARTIYVRWGLVHITGSFGANIGEVWMEYQTPSTAAKPEVKATYRFI